jgi:gliding motility-associated-like protein
LPSSDMDTWSVTPPGWDRCNDGSTPDLQPNAWGVRLPPSEGETYLGIICRLNGTQEAVSQILTQPLQKDVFYCFSADLAFDDSAPHRVGKPVKLKVWGTAGGCENRELLWTSPLIDHTFWKKYEICFKPTKTLTTLILEATFPNQPNQYGYVLVDNLSAIEGMEGWTETLCIDDSLNVSATPRGTLPGEWQVRWMKNEFTPAELSTPQRTLYRGGAYEVALSRAGRTYPVSLKVQEQECLSNFFIPNVITPNGDAFNEAFEIRGIEKGVWQLQIYNRWGKVVYQSQSYANDWSSEEAGLYYYHLQNRQSQRVYKGYLHVLR